MVSSHVQRRVRQSDTKLGNLNVTQAYWPNLHVVRTHDGNNTVPMYTSYGKPCYLFLIVKVDVVDVPIWCERRIFPASDGYIQSEARRKLLLRRRSDGLDGALNLRVCLHSRTSSFCAELLARELGRVV